MELLPFLTGLKEVVVTIAAATGAFVAYKGLTKWKEELKGRSNHETAKLILTSTFNVRKAVHIVRNNWISLDEYPTSQNVSDADKYTHMFKQRWEILDSAIHELEYAKIQGQALWGKDFEKIFHTLNAAIHELNYSINSYLEMLSKHRTHDELLNDESLKYKYLECKSIIFHVPILDLHCDSYAGRLYKAMKEIEDSVKIYI